MNKFKSAHKLLGLFVALAAVLFAVAPVRAGQILSAKVALSDSRQGQSNTHTFTFSPPSSGVIDEVVFKYCKKPSASDGSCTKPEGFSYASAALGTLGGTLTGGTWVLTTENDHTLKIAEDGAGYTHTGGNEVIIPFTTIVNHTIASADGDTCDQDNDFSSDTCYVRITTHATIGGATVDEGAVSYTVIRSVTVTARVDPSFTFVVAGVAANSTNNGVTTSALSTFNTLPFGNLAVDVPKYVAHSLTVTTNTLNGYAIYAKMLTQMTGGFASNNIDPFVGAAGTATATAPVAWSNPNGTSSNTNTGWLGFNTSDTDITGWGSGSGLFGPLGATDVMVMQGAASDPGTAPVYVSYVIGVNVYQPADTYTGTLLYNALPTY